MFCNIERIKKAGEIGLFADEFKTLILQRFLIFHAKQCLLCYPFLLPAEAWTRRQQGQRN